MDLNTGEQVFFRLSKDPARLNATVVSFNDSGIVLRVNEEMPRPVVAGEQIIISAQESDFYTEVLNSDKSMIHLRRLWCDRREYFRVDDSFPVSCSRTKREATARKSKILSGFGTELVGLELPDDSIHPQLWKMLVDINTKIGMLLERLTLKDEGLLNVQDRPVNLSATGMRVSSPESAGVGDSLEIRMLLPTYPPLGILAYGRVVRVETKENGEYDLALHFEEMDEEVRDEIIQYALKRQREICKSQRKKEK